MPEVTNHPFVTTPNPGPSVAVWWRVVILLFQLQIVNNSFALSVGDGSHGRGCSEEPFREREPLQVNA